VNVDESYLRTGLNPRAELASRRDSMTMGKWRLYALIVLIGIFALAVLALSQNASAVVDYTNNEDAAHAIWIEPPVSLNEVHIWKRSGGRVNQDWWKFNATAGQHVEVRFRKYTEYQNPQPPFEGATYYINYHVLDIASRPIYQYTRGYGGGGSDPYYRDAWGYIVPEHLSGAHYIRVFVNPPGNENRDHAYYWLNVTVTDPPSLDVQHLHSGVMEMQRAYPVDYNHEDYYTINLTAGSANADLVTITLNKGEANADIRLEVWEYIPFGNSQTTHMVNRTQSGDRLVVEVEFIATYTGLYHVRVRRDFNNLGSTSYHIQVTMGTKGHDANDLAGYGTKVSTSTKFYGIPLEMGYDTHDWYQVSLLKGDTLFKVSVTIYDDTIDAGHGLELVVYNGTGVVKWRDSNLQSGPTWSESLDVPPSGTVTIFDWNETYYVRLSANPEESRRGFSGFRATYDITFTLSNRPPALIEPFLEVYEWNEDETISIELDSHFSDPDGDKMVYTIYNKSGQWKHDVPGLTYWGYLNITPPRDFNGEVWWRLRAKDEGQDDPLHNIFIDLRLVVLPMPDIPISNGTKRVECDEEGSVSFSLTKLFYDTDMGAEGVLTYGLNVTGQTDVVVTLDTSTGEVTYAPAPDVTGFFEFTFYAEDISEIPVYGVVELTVNPLNDIPRIRQALPLVEMNEGDPPKELDLAPFFYDVDGDELLFSIKLPQEYQGDLNVFHKNNVKEESRIIIEITNPSFYGSLVVNITAKDPSETTVSQDLNIRIINVPNPPFIEYIPLGNPGDVPEGSQIEFEVTDILDADEPEFGLHTYTWYMDGVIVENFNVSAFVYEPGYEEAGTHNVKVEVRDPTGLLATTVPIWTFKVIDVNRNPTVSIDPPMTTEVREDEEVSLSATFSDLDSGDELMVTWWLVGDKYENLGTGSSLSTKLPPGDQTIEVVVEDGRGGEATDTIDFTVEDVKEESGFGLPIGILAVIIVVVVIVVALMLMMKRKRPVVVDTKIDIESLEQSYEDQLGGYEKPDGGF
jgi:hypothetical protein